jgi:3',5'-nucleoside bisphosphate phosphatase
LFPKALCQLNRSFETARAGSAANAVDFFVGARFCYDCGPSCLVLHSLHIDLHTHSTYSDGVLPPETLVWRAARRGVKVLALTDHDETAGLGEAARAAAAAGIGFVPGIEISASWRSQTIHVLGLGIDSEDPALKQGLAFLRSARENRAEKIAESLRLAGIGDALRGARIHAGTGVSIGRSHFARFLVERGHNRDFAEAFRIYLGAGKCAHVAPVWPDMGDAVSWIHSAGGIAALAHPERYRLSAAAMRALLEAFKQAGGEAFEIGTGDRSFLLQQMRTARRFGFDLSTGSDFHAPGEGARDVGDTADLGDSAFAVWHRHDVLRTLS